MNGRKIQYAVMDFEFTNLGRDNLILISGAIKGRHSLGLVTKLEGRALVLRENRVVTPDEWKDMVHHLVRIFKKKPQTLYPILAQIYDSDVSTKPNLTKKQILDLLKPYDVIILWEGSTDIKILKTLGAPHIALSMRGWDVDFNGRFFLQLMYDKLVIVSHFIGEIQKNGCALKLSETQSLVCKGDHGCKEAHNPITDVIWSRCLFGFLRLNYSVQIDDAIVGTLRFTDERLTQHSGIYYENRGPLKLITSQWNLTAYISFAKYNEQFDYIDTIIGKTKTLCNDHERLVNSSFNCNSLLAVTDDIIDDLLRKKTQVLDSIGHVIIKRNALLNFAAKAARLIYGICNLECIKKFNFNIGVAKNTSQSKLIKEQIKVVQLNHNIGTRKYFNISLDLSDITNVTEEKQQIKNYLTKHFIQVNLLVTKHILETNTLLEIIHQAKIGVVHPSLITPQELLEHVKDIKVSLPGGTDLPTDLDISNIYELVKLSDVAIYYANDNLVFIISLPLIYQNDFILYNLIPVPVCIGNDCVYIKPINKYLAISKSKEHYATYDEFYYTHCKHARDFLLCPEGNLLHPRCIRPTCEVLLLQDPSKVPPSCEVMHVQIGTTIFHKKRFKNEWIYVINYDVIFVTCDEDKESTSHTLKGVGIIHLNETCKGYATRDILLPGKVDSKSEYADFNPKSIIDRNQYTTHIETNDLMEDYHVKTNNMDDLNAVSNSKKQLDSQNKINLKIEEIQDIQQWFNYALYMTIGFIVMVMMLMTIHGIKTNLTGKCKNKLPEHDQEENVELNQPTTTHQNEDIIEFPLTTRNSLDAQYPRLQPYGFN
ncbi:Integrase catalytic domain-containing protein [Aphis craccivora]|uniref:Integrase catalytic domain-containing protein n=1 Tax=Aphis craccivora TaxID=307492 RepID=A0A6G0WFQ0_APHCR|nr:Integrase catalytic domain-containing protein [Aphis craccivora]